MLVPTILISLLLLSAQEATGIGSGPQGPGAPPDMPISSGADAPGTPGGTSRNPGVYRKVTPAQANDYVARTAAARAQAAALAANAGQITTEQVPAIRNALQADMEIWRDAFHIDQREWRANSAAWLVGVDSLTPGQWASRRSQWFTSRDQWLEMKLGRRGK